MWNGNTIPESDHVHIDFHLQDQGLSFWIQAPFYHDPAPSEKGPSLWGLWNHEVVEFFLVGEDMQYLEAEFGPHGHHLLLWLDKPRNILHKHLSVTYHTQITNNRWQGEGHISSQHLPKNITRWNLFSIHGTNEHRRYQCMFPMQTPKPDFHQPHQFPAFPETT